MYWISCIRITKKEKEKEENIPNFQYHSLYHNNNRSKYRDISTDNYYLSSTISKSTKLKKKKKKINLILEQINLRQRFIQHDKKEALRKK